ncbi:MAG: hypothetical protein ACLVC4_04255, partial [Gordonibacter urolithinfaciens]
PDKREVAGSNPFGPTIFCDKRSTVSRVSRWSVYYFPKKVPFPFAEARSKAAGARRNRTGH